MKVRHIFSGALISASLILGACSAPKDITYVQGLTDRETSTVANPLTIKVRPEDKLNIIVSTQREELNNLFNLKSPQTTGTERPSYTVNPEGCINFPMLGEIHVAGLTRAEVAKYIEKELTEKDLVKNPVVIVEYGNTAIYVGGEVNTPGKFEINKDRLTVLQAILMAGDLTIQGKRENVLVLREENGKQTAYRLDLTDPDQLFNSPAYYLQQNDVVYVEPNDVRKRQTTTNGNTALTATFWMSVASLAMTVAVLIFR